MLLLHNDLNIHFILLYCAVLSLRKSFQIVTQQCATLQFAAANMEKLFAVNISLDMDTKSPDYAIQVFTGCALGLAHQLSHLS